MKTFLTAAAGAALLFATPAVAQSQQGKDSRPDIVDAASGNDDFSVLVDFVVAAGLVETLQANGPLTVLAPTNGAFVAACDELQFADVPTCVAALKSDIPALQGILAYHVIDGRFPRGRLFSLARRNIDGVDVETLAGGTINIRMRNGEFVITDARDREIGVVAADINTSNGVIHAINRVLLP